MVNKIQTQKHKQVTLQNREGEEEGQLTHTMKQSQYINPKTE